MGWALKLCFSRQPRPSYVRNPALHMQPVRSSAVVLPHVIFAEGRAMAGTQISRFWDPSRWHHTRRSRSGCPRPASRSSPQPRGDPAGPRPPSRTSAPQQQRCHGAVHPAGHGTGDMTAPRRPQHRHGHDRPGPAPPPLPPRRPPLPPPWPRGRDWREGSGARRLLASPGSFFGHRGLSEVSGGGVIKVIKVWKLEEVAWSSCPWPPTQSVGATSASCSPAGGLQLYRTNQAPVTPSENINV